MQNLFSSAKEKPRHQPLHGKNPTYQGTVWGVRSLKKPKYYGWTHPSGSLNFKGSVSTLGKIGFQAVAQPLSSGNSKLSSTSYVVFITCPAPWAEISRCHVRAGHIRRKWYYWLLSFILFSEPALFIQNPKSQRYYKLYRSPSPFKEAPQGRSPGWRTGEDYTGAQIKLKGKKVGEQGPVRDDSCKIMLWIYL